MSGGVSGAEPPPYFFADDLVSRAAAYGNPVTTEGLMLILSRDESTPGLPGALSVVVNQLARYLDAVLPDGEQKRVALTRLLQARDASVRSVLNLPGNGGGEL